MIKRLIGALFLSALPLLATPPAEQTAGANAAQIQAFIDDAGRKHGAAGTRAAEFLVAGMPPEDLRSLKADFLTQNLDLAFQAREEFPWAAQVPEDVFFNDVLPYAVFDETRETWRKELMEKCRKIVAGSKTA